MKGAGPLLRVWTWVIMFITGLAAIFGTLGSVESIAESAKKFQVFGNP